MMDTTPAVRVRIYTVADVATVIMNDLSGVVDGGTIHHGRGWWTDTATGDTDTEDSVTMDIVTTPDTVDTIAMVATAAAVGLYETCIMMTVDTTDMAMIWTDGRTDGHDDIATIVAGASS